VRHDLDSVGLVLYELLTGVCPKSSTSPDVAYLPPSHHASWINSEVDQLLSRVLSPNDAKRFQTARELRQALDEYLSSRRHDVTSTHVAGLLSVLFAPECHDSAPPTMRFQAPAAEVAQRRSRRTTPPDHGSTEFSATEIPTYNPIARAGIQASPGSQRSQPTMPAPLAEEVAKAKPVMESSTQPTAPRQHERPANGGGDLGDQDKGTEGAEHRGGPFRHDWDLALKRAREEALTNQRGSGNFPNEPGVARPAPPLDPIEQAVVEFERGLEHMRGGQFEQALNAWERALELDPQHRVCRANLSLLKKKLGSQI
jgi:tetratricopeptide (TPR) repeat protein